MLATFIIETVAVLYVVWRYKWNEITRLVVLILTFLATFQLAEYMVCEGTEQGWFTWARIGYVAITLLPPLGLHLAYALVDAKKRPLLWIAYPVMAAFIGYFVFVDTSLGGHVCAGNYIIFEMMPAAGWLYSGYYFGLLVAGVVVSLQFMMRSKSKNLRRALAGLILGYGAFIVPTTLVRLIAPETQAAIPSVMCGFAVLLSILLVFMVLPAIMRKR